MSILSFACRFSSTALMLFGMLQAVYAENTADIPSFQVQNLDRAMKRFVRAPHPMGSAEQKKLAAEITSGLSKEGWDAQIVKFKTKIPNVAAQSLGGNDKKAPTSKEIEGENIVAVSSGSERCMIIIGGHYDTKYFKQFTFVGANDGGSSTAVMQELARVISQIRKKEVLDVKAEKKVTERQTGRFLDCSIALAFFDGEEAFLPEWNDGENVLGLQDNLYGSRVFAERLEKKFEGTTFKGLPIKAAIVIDMIGHKNQSLFITAGSHPQLSQKLVAQKTVTKIAIQNIAIQDDHLPLAKQGVPFIHIIDWTNIDEWHTARDTLDIISTKNMADFGDLMVRFLMQKR